MSVETAIVLPRRSAPVRSFEPRALTSTVTGDLLRVERRGRDDAHGQAALPRRRDRREVGEADVERARRDRGEDRAAVRERCSCASRPARTKKPCACA